MDEYEGLVPTRTSLLSRLKRSDDSVGWRAQHQIRKPVSQASLRLSVRPFNSSKSEGAPMVIPSATTKVLKSKTLACNVPKLGMGSSTVGIFPPLILGFRDLGLSLLGANPGMGFIRNLGE